MSRYVAIDSDRNDDWKIESEHSHSSSRDTRAHRDTRSRVRTPESSHRKRYESFGRKEQRSQEQQSKKKHQRESPSTITFDERIEQETGGGLLKVWEGLPEEIDRELSKNEAKKKLPTDEDIDRILAKRAKVSHSLIVYCSFVASILI
ncbi:unnamed protein product [Anisakis simplex]|uniref:Uncharacterized protein n=1 Tax=Anisakis simplex TaxID=6269 RepID=A0A0M3KJ17_ANISI|nr:unnamed protein product [Anisakis simplex]